MYISSLDLKFLWVVVTFLTSIHIFFLNFFETFKIDVLKLEHGEHPKNGSTWYFPLTVKPLLKKAQEDLRKDTERSSKRSMSGRQVLHPAHLFPSWEISISKPTIWLNMFLSLSVGRYVCLSTPHNLLCTHECSRAMNKVCQGCLKRKVYILGLALLIAICFSLAASEIFTVSFQLRIF